MNLKFVKKPVEIDATSYQSEIQYVIDWFNELDCNISFEDVFFIEDEVLKIKTLEGFMTVSHNDWIIRGIAGEFYPCKPDIFVRTYDKV